MTSREDLISDRGVPSESPPPAPARWEWRSFDYQPDRWRKAFGSGLAMSQATLSPETYLLVPDMHVSVKLRNDRLEIKQLLQTGRGGLQQWSPTLVAPFPIAPADLAKLLEVWHCQVSEALPSVATSDALVRWLLTRVPHLHVVPVRKWRRGQVIHGCRAERATILARGEVLESLAFEHEDPATLLATLQSHGLDAQPNTSYPMALGRLLGLAEGPISKPTTPPS